MFPGGLRGLKGSVLSTPMSTAPVSPNSSSAGGREGGGEGGEGGREGGREEGREGGGGERTIKEY